MKIYIIGVGGVGGYFGGLLAKAGCDVTFVARSEQFKALKENGLRVRSVNENFNIKPVKVVENVSEITSPDLILVTVKTYDTESVASELSCVVNDHTVIITFQNGVENDLELKKYINNTLIFPGVAYIISKRSEPGIIEQTGGLRKLVFGDRNFQYIDVLESVERMMKDAGINANLSDDITRDLWKKFIFICPFAGLTAMYKKTIGQILADPILHKEYEECLNEAITVAKTIGVNLPEDIFESTMNTTNNTAPDSKSSLLVDVENSRQTEIETLNGALVRMAKEKGINLPVNEKIYNFVKSI